MKSGNNSAFELLRAMRRFLGENDMMAYLAMMAIRLIELHRVLKPTGSLYLHCDPTASTTSSCCWTGCLDRPISLTRSYGTGLLRRAMPSRALRRPTM